MVQIELNHESLNYLPQSSLSTSSLDAAASVAMAARALLRVGGVPEHFNYPLRLASKAAAAPFAWTEYAGGSGEMATALREGELDVAILLTEAAALFAHKGEVTILGAYTTTPLCWGVHASAARPAPALDAATYGVSRFGSGSHIMALVDARGRGAPPPAFEVVRDLAGARDALASGAADVFMWEKFTTKPLVDSGEWVRVAEVPTPWPCFTLVATKDAARDRAADIGDTLRAVRGRSLAMPDLAADVAADYGLQVEDAATWLATVGWSSGLRMPRAVLAAATDALVDADLLAPHELLGYPELVADFTRDEALDLPEATPLADLREK